MYVLLWMVVQTVKKRLLKTQVATRMSQKVRKIVLMMKMMTRMAMKTLQKVAKAL